LSGDRNNSAFDWQETAKQSGSSSQQFGQLLAPAQEAFFSFVPTLPVSGRGGRALNLGNKAAEDP